MFLYWVYGEGDINGSLCVSRDVSYELALTDEEGTFALREQGCFLFSPLHRLYILVRSA